MADYLKKPILGFPNIAQMGQQNGGANYFGEPGMPPIAQSVSPEEQVQNDITTAAGNLTNSMPMPTPYAMPDYGSAANSLPTYGYKGAMIGPNQNYSDPNDPKSTAYALTQGINHLATGSLSARQNQKFQRGQAAQDLVRNFLAPLAATFGPNGAAQGVKDYMKTSAEQATKAKELNLKEQADAITQMKTMADMLAKNTPYTKDSIELIIKRAAEEQKIKNSMSQANAQDALAQQRNVGQWNEAAQALKNTQGIFESRAKKDLGISKAEGEVAKTEKTVAQTATEKEKTKTQAATTGLRENQATLAEDKSAKTKADTAQVKRKADAEIALKGQQKATSAAEEALKNTQNIIAKAKDSAGKWHEGEASPAEIGEVMKKTPPGMAARFDAAIASIKKNKGTVTLRDVHMVNNALQGQHEHEVAAMKGKGGSPPSPPMSFKKTRL